MFSSDKIGLDRTFIDPSRNVVIPVFSGTCGLQMRVHGFADLKRRQAQRRCPRGNSQRDRFQGRPETGQ